MTTDTELEDEYPHWRTAIFGNHNAVANLRCAVHYLFWHTVYALIAVVGLLTVGVIKGAMFVGNYLGPVGAKIEPYLDRAIGGINTIANHRYTEYLFVAVAICIIAIAGILVISGLLYYLYTNPVDTLLAIGFILSIVGGVLALLFIAAKLKSPAKSATNTVARGARSAGEKAVETPGVRRVYGQCPVSMDMAPKWFDNMFDN
jgi:hypothetical protein